MVVRPFWSCGKLRYGKQHSRIGVLLYEVIRASATRPYGYAFSRIGILLKEKRRSFGKLRYGKDLLIRVLLYKCQSHEYGVF
ncbi:MAG: hypothetical protein CVU48_08840 [Candidatus Cloacimonetes bacterium HGW-Cloacimonetes-1]|jgi:hypothetical protein|nr:MAG: hypothetical protein CVU48_08840 [Candidatus Cloacimonetes bacterium HGW-Cloacimonetes-1]